jgi:predicted transcriptional regulator
MKAVMISINPKWCGLIASGKKTLEIRKTQPKLKPPFKCYIYCTNDKKLQLWTNKRYSYADDHSHNLFDRCGNGKVIGEFVCDRIRVENEVADQLVDVGLMRHSCLRSEELLRYADGKALYSWHISDLKIYDEPKPLCEFEHPPYLDCDIPCRLCKYGFKAYGAFGEWYDCDRKLKRPPQSWCYIVERRE